MNNDVKDHDGEIIGFRCSVCGEVKHKMWGQVCNKCDLLSRILKESMIRGTVVIINGKIIDSNDLYKDIHNEEDLANIYEFMQCQREGGDKDGKS